EGAFPPGGSALKFTIAIPPQLTPGRQRVEVTTRDSVSRIGRIALLAAMYFAAGKLGLSLAVAHGIATPVWPPTGISLAALLMMGTGVWPGIAVGAFLVNITSRVPIPVAIATAFG